MKKGCGFQLRILPSSQAQPFWGTSVPFPAFQGAQSLGGVLGSPGVTAQPKVLLCSAKGLDLAQNLEVADPPYSWISPSQLPNTDLSRTRHYLSAILWFCQSVLYTFWSNFMRGIQVRFRLIVTFSELSLSFFPNNTLCLADKWFSVHLPPSVLLTSLYHVFKASFANGLQLYMFFKNDLISRFWWAYLHFH